MTFEPFFKWKSTQPFNPYQTDYS